MKHLALSLALALFASGACKKDDKAAGAGGGGKPAAVDNSDPVKVVEHVFAAAAAGTADGLAGLCDPAGSGDGDVKRVCGANPQDPKWSEFTSYFAKGKVKGAPRTDADSAEVDFTFGPDGTKEETMKLKKIGGKWYLGSF
jgi:hypothetical protein